MSIWIIGLVLLSTTIIAQEDNHQVRESLRGFWELNADQSDDPDKKLKGKLRKRLQPQKLFKRKHPGSNRSSPEVAMNHYWETLRASQERKASKNLKRLGPAFLLFTFENIEISKGEETLISFSYDDSPRRIISPNKKGRIFSAKGAELTTSYFGHTLSYYQSNRLVLETDAPDGGKFIEKLSISKGNLQYEIIIDSLVLKESVSISRTFNKR